MEASLKPNGSMYAKNYASTLKELATLNPRFLIRHYKRLLTFFNGRLVFEGLHCCLIVFVYVIAETPSLNESAATFFDSLTFDI